jgi:hypothetical protein
MLVFGVNGFLFACDDYLEMASLSKMHGAAFQVLNQSKILITAFLVMPCKGVYHTRLQWILLSSLMVAMSLYMCAPTGDATDSDNEIPFYAYFFVLLKVTFSCLAVVYTDKFAKVYAATVSLPAQLTQTYFARVIFAVMLTGLTPQIWSGFFKGWDARTVLVTVSFAVKSSTSFVVIATLDSILKNLAECVAVLLIFCSDVAQTSHFDITMFLCVMVIILLIGAYMDSKKIVEKAAKYDESCAKV